MSKLRTCFGVAPALAALLVGRPAPADEGLWTFDNFPKPAVRQKYGFAPDDAWLEHLRLSSLRLGASASLVSPRGLVLTNHHVARPCIQQLSTAARDYVATGFYARTEADEGRCPEMEAGQLVAITDVTGRVAKATGGLSGAAANDARKAEIARIEKECAKSPKDRCDVVTLYHGGRYHLYRYRRFQDVRLVFAPEHAIAFFGGDPDNFTYPRYDLDFALLRVYDEGRPLKSEHYLRWSAKGAQKGDLSFVSGHPGATQRQLTVAQLEYERDVVLPERLLSLAELRGVLTQFQKRGPEQRRISLSLLFGTENSFKALKGRYQALRDPSLFGSKVAAEKALRARLASDPAKRAKYEPAFEAIAGATRELASIRKPFDYIERGNGFSGRLFGIARTLVRGGEERPKPNERRLAEFRESALPQVSHRLLSGAPIYDELEILQLTFSLTKLREELGADHPFVKRVLGKESPEEVAKRLVMETRLKDVVVRRQLWEGGQHVVAASDDPMIVLARRIDPEARAIRKRFEDDIESVEHHNGELIAQARFEIEGTSTYPDATGTLRLSYGQVQGYQENGRRIAPTTTLAGAFDRATGRPPFDLPESWLAKKSALDLGLTFNFCTTNDVIGGNSGSPVVDRRGELIGLVFDGNIQSLGGEYGFDETVNRAVAVSSAAILEALSKIYRADRIVNELRPPKSGATGMP